MTARKPVDAVSLANHIIEEYAADLAGSAADALGTVLDRLVLNGAEPASDVKQLITRMRGPYLQALAAPRMSDRRWSEFATSVRGVFAPTGFLPDLVRLLQGQGFRHLHSFQEHAMEAILSDRDVLITAGTGRGKTEAWLLPILQYVLLAKRGALPGEPTAGTKALLVYPTKALAQDQLRRLIRYLLPVNSSQPPGNRISVGIFDGDTPSGGDVRDRDYLYHAFRLFECPIGYGGPCAGCSRGLVVRPRGSGHGRLTLVLPEPECEQRLQLDFVVLTREDMIREQPDILITNPDMIHLRLLNVNDHRWRRLLIEDPRFLVIDEIHTYSGTFGANVAWIIRRLRTARRASGVGRPLRVAAASATVSNGPELFTRVAGVDPASAVLVNEQVREVPPSQAPTLAALPPVLLRRDWTPLTPAEWFADADISDALGGGLPAGVEGAEPGEVLYNRVLGEDESTKPPALGFVRWLYGELRRGAATPSEIREALSATYPDLLHDQADLVLSNSVSVATAAGLLESRAHLFGWPIDGYYVCATCGSIYLDPRSECRCGKGFITRLATCTVGEELAAEGWLCPVCLSVYPFVATEEGQFIAYDAPSCEAGHTCVNCVRVVWRPYARCPQCGAIGRQGERCCQCGRVVPHAGRGTEGKCQACGETGEPGVCRCGGTVRTILRLPWACGKCGALHDASGGVPVACAKCGHSRTVLGGLLEVRRADYCEACSAEIMPGRGCGHDDHDLTPSASESDEYRLVDNVWRLRRPSDHRDAVPCYHPYARYALHSRYISLSRSPANVAVTASQIALRHVVSAADCVEDGRQQAKMLSFSDSHNDMEQLARDFNDPEVDTFLDQAIYYAAEKEARGLVQVIDDVRNALPAQIRRSREWQPRDIGKRVLARFVRGRYGSRSGPPTLAAHGLVDLYWERLPSDGDVLDVLARLVAYNGLHENTVRGDLGWSAERLARAVSKGEDEGWLTRSPFGTLNLGLQHLAIRVVGAGSPIYRLPNKRFIVNAVHQLKPESQATAYEVAPQDRAQPEHPDYSRAARRILSTEHPLLLIGETYKGSTPKHRRRQLEYAFARSEQPNFLSSGPALEIGIDIGQLDRVLLYGTPPNINAYLQRIGRAGRRSKQALVLTVSKRNPIDLYYYRNPLRLIESEPQPVPMQEHNLRVIEAALTWAVMDFVALHFNVPWRRERSGGEQSVWCDGEPTRRDAGDPTTTTGLSWLRVLLTPTESVDAQALFALQDLVQAHRHEVRDYLRSLLDYALCSHCGQRVRPGEDSCERIGCAGESVQAADYFGGLIEDAIAEFPDRLVWAPLSVVERYRSTVEELQQRSLSLSRVGRGLGRRERGRVEHELRQVNAQLRVLLKLEESAGEATLRENHEHSEFARFGYGIRGVEDQVAVKLVSGGTSDPRAIQTNRDVGPALREFAPGAVTLYEGEEFVTLAVLPNEAQGERLSSRLTELEQPASRACLRCATIVQGPGTCPRCGQATIGVELLVPGEVHAYRRDEALQDDPGDSRRKLYPSQAFPLGSSETAVESTFVNGNTAVLSFSPQRSARISDGAGCAVGLVEVGEVELLFTADSITAQYETGERDGRPRLFELCGHRGCGGVIAPGRGSVQGYCMIDPSHDIGRRRVVQLASRLATIGVRLSRTDLVPFGHSLLHGLRVGLEKVAGEPVRGIGEHLAGEAAYLFDNEAGGKGVCELLLDPTEGFRNFATALAVAADLARCFCEDGCPQCLYQFGCATRNDPTTLSRRSLAAFLDTGPRLELVEEPTRSGA